LGMFAYAFPPFRFLLQVLLKIKQSDCKIILIAPAWPRQAWFPELLLLSCARPLKLSFRRDLLSRDLHEDDPTTEQLSRTLLAVVPILCWLDCGSETDNLPVHWRSLEYAWLPDECVVDSQGKCFDRCSFASPSSFSNSVYRFQSSGMGSLSRGKVCVGSVVSCSATRTHQFVRDESCPISVTTTSAREFRKPSSWENCRAVTEGLLLKIRIFWQSDWNFSSGGKIRPKSVL
jgi:hypothetical protein